MLPRWNSTWWALCSALRYERQPRPRCRHAPASAARSAAVTSPSGRPVWISSRATIWEAIPVRTRWLNPSSAAAARKLRFADVEDYLRVRRVEQGWSLRRMLTERRWGSAWLKDQMHRLGIP
jgi:hypothetical protein